MSSLVLLRRFITNSHVGTFFLTFWLGWCGYSLKLVSIIKLIDELSFNAYPPLMLVLGIVLLGSVQIFKKLSEKSEKTFHIMTIFFALVVVFIGNNHQFNLIADGANGWIYSAIMFLASAVSVVAIDMSSRVFISKKISILKNPHVAGQISFMQEIGIIAGATFAIYAQHFSWEIKPLFATLPFAIALLTLILMQYSPSEEHVSNNVIDLNGKSKNIKKEGLRVMDYPFVSLLIAVITVGLICKHIQGYALLIGIKQWQSTYNTSVTSIFSNLSIVQTIIILLALLPSMFRMNIAPTWSKGFNIFFGTQSASMILITILSTPMSLIGTGITRKIIQHALYNRSLTLLDSSIPQKVRMDIKNIVEKYAQTISYLTLAILSGLAIYRLLPHGVIWIACSLLAVTGIYLRKKLQTTLNNFQVSHIVKTDVYEAVAACYSLANRESQSHHAALASLLKQNPRPILAKAIIFALGEMKKKENVDTIINYYKTIDREDIQLVSINAMMKYQSYKIDLFLQKTLQNIIAEQTSLGEIRSSIYTAISHRIPSVAILTTLNLLEQYKNDYRILANVIEVLSKIARTTRDESLFHILSEYIDPKYSRRIRTNALHGLFFSKKYHLAAQECLDSFLTSTEKYDQSAAAFLAGSFELKGLLPFVYKISEDAQHKNSTILISLIKLKYEPAFSLFVDYVVNADSEPAIVAINQLHTVESTKLRYQVYFELLTKRPGDVMIFMDLLRDSNRNFDHDRQVIREEAARLNIDISEDYRLFEEKQIPPKAA